MTPPAVLHRFLRLTALMLLLLGGARASAAAAAPQSLTTLYFTIYYPTGEETAATWYAGFADDVDVAVSTLLGDAPVTGLTLQIYATEAEYATANPLAELHPGIMAHAIPERKEIGVAVERLRQEDPALARESFRHEMTHIVAGALSGQNLPVGFQEGLAQYDELSATRAQAVVQAIQTAEDNDTRLLTWAELNDDRQFRQHLDLAYPESYTVMAFLADHYGMSDYARFLAELRHNHSYEAALQAAYGQSLATLQTQWTAYLPTFLQDGWKLNLLSAYDLAPARALYATGQFADARDQFALSARLYTDLGRSNLAAEAATAHTQAAQAATAATLAAQARTALESHDYVAAQPAAEQAAQSFAQLNLTEYQQRATATADLSRKGVAALAALTQAQAHQQGFTLLQAANEAQQADETFAALGDGPHVDVANRILADVERGEQGAGLGALGAGGLALLGAGLAAWRARRRRPSAPLLRREEHLSWL